MQTNRKAIVAAIAGNAMEWYDFTVFALMTPVIKNLFFPVDPKIPGSEINALLLTTALFGTGFFMRPIGGLVLGYFGDRKGRKAAMTLGMGIMALSVALLALTPTYATAGIAAPLIVLLARLFQGFSVGGEFGTSTAYLIEAAPPGRTGFYGSWQIAGQLMANVLGAVLGAALTLTFTQEQLVRRRLAYSLLRRSRDRSDPALYARQASSSPKRPGAAWRRCTRKHFIAALKTSRPQFPDRHGHGGSERRVVLRHLRLHRDLRQGGAEAAADAELPGADDRGDRDGDRRPHCRRHLRPLSAQAAAAGLAHWLFRLALSAL